MIITGTLLINEDMYRSDVMGQSMASRTSCQPTVGTGLCSSELPTD